MLNNHSCHWRPLTVYLEETNKFLLTDQYECIEDGFGTNCECFVVYVPAGRYLHKGSQ